MITKEAILHIPKSNYSYAYDENTLHFRIRTLKNEVNKVVLRIGDPYNWAEGGLDGGNLNGSSAKGWLGANNIEMKKELSTEYHDYWFCEYSPSKKRVRYAFILEDNQEKILFGEKHIKPLKNNIEDEYILSDISNFFAFPYINKKDILDAPEWAKNIIWYQIFPERFANGNNDISPKNVEVWGSKPTHNNFMGGDLYGLYEKIDYLNELRITGIYLCPIFYADTNHKYDTIDYYKIDPHFGDEEILKKIIDKAHKKGMKIMLDAVFNHVGENFPYWQDVVKNKENSIYKDWFVINKFPLYSETELNYETFANVKEMPKLNLENEQCRKYALDIAKYWVKEYDIDAWRLDVCNEIDHQFWREFRQEVKKIKKDVYILGEIWHDALPWLKGDQFDAVMNYPLSDAIIQFLYSDIFDIEKFKVDINKIIVAYPKNITEVNFNLLDSHDTSRIYSTLNNNKEKLKLAFTLLFFQSGSPCIYYGTEIGMDGEKNNFLEDNRKCMIWNEDQQDKELFSFFKKLIEIRKTEKSFQNVDIEWKYSDKDNILSLQKNDLYLIINLEKTEQAINLEEYILDDTVKDLFTGEILMKTHLKQIKPLEFLLLKKKH